MSRIVAVFVPAWRRGEARVHYLQSQALHARTLCGREPMFWSGPASNSSGAWRRCRLMSARGTWCETCVRLAGIRRV